MEYVKTFKGRGPLILESGVTSEIISSACRNAALEFMANASSWDKAALAEWLSGPYANATRFLDHGERTVIFTSTSRAALDPATVEAVVMQARRDVLAGLSSLARAGDGALGFANELVERGFVRCAAGTTGDEVWLPVDGPRILLRDRVSALFVADYLNDFLGYAELHVCAQCEGIGFGDGPCEPSYYALRRGPSGIQTKHLDDDRARAVGDED